MSYFMNRVEIPVFEVYHYYAVETVNEAIMKNLINSNSIIGVIYNITISCTTKKCPNYGIQRLNNIENTRRTTHSFESNLV